MRIGCRSMKIKVGTEKPADPARVALVRAGGRGPSVELMVDANGANTVPEALGWAERFRDLGVDLLRGARFLARTLLASRT